MSAGRERERGQLSIRSLTQFEANRYRRAEQQPDWALITYRHLKTAPYVVQCIKQADA
jgi:hypothetical protein